MATATSLRSRRSEAQWHALAGVEREIRATDPSSRRKYLRDFSAAFRSYQSVVHSEELKALIGAPDLLLIGDYHALPACQRFAASLLEQRTQLADRNVVLGVETIFARDQHILDEWWRREIDEAEFRQRIRFDLDWGYDWAPFYELLVTARDHAEAIYGLDCMPREDLRKIGARDRHAAHKLAEIRQKHPNAVIVVLFGESHLAPGPSTGSPPASNTSKWRPYGSPKIRSASSTPLRWRNTRTTACTSAAGDVPKKKAPILRPLCIT